MAQVEGTSVGVGGSVKKPEAKKPEVKQEDVKKAVDKGLDIAGKVLKDPVGAIKKGAEAIGKSLFGDTKKKEEKKPVSTNEGIQQLTDAKNAEIMEAVTNAVNNATDTFFTSLEKGVEFISSLQNVDETDAVETQNDTADEGGLTDNQQQNGAVGENGAKDYFNQYFGSDIESIKNAVDSSNIDLPDGFSFDDLGNYDSAQLQQYAKQINDSLKENYDRTNPNRLAISPNEDGTAQLDIDKYFDEVAHDENYFSNVKDKLSSDIASFYGVDTTQEGSVDKLTPFYDELVSNNNLGIDKNSYETNAEYIDAVNTKLAKLSKDGQIGNDLVSLPARNSFEPQAQPKTTYDGYTNWQEQVINGEDVPIEYDFMEGLDPNNEENYEAQIAKLAQGEHATNDTDGDGKLTVDEYIQKNTVENMDEYDKDTMKNLADMIDTDGDGEISEEEFGNLYRNLDRFNPETSSLDEKGDGKIDIMATTRFELEDDYVTSNYADWIYKNFNSLDIMDKFDIETASPNMEEGGDGQITEQEALKLFADLAIKEGKSHAEAEAAAYLMFQIINGNFNDNHTIKYTDKNGNEVEEKTVDFNGIDSFIKTALSLGYTPMQYYNQIAKNNITSEDGAYYENYQQLLGTFENKE